MAGWVWQVRAGGCYLQSLAAKAVSNDGLPVPGAERRVVFLRLGETPERDGIEVDLSSGDS